MLIEGMETGEKGKTFEAIGVPVEQLLVISCLDRDKKFQLVLVVIFANRARMFQRLHIFLQGLFVLYLDLE